MKRRLLSYERHPKGELDHLRAENAQLQRRLAEMERTVAIQLTASRILLTYDADEREPGGAER